MSSIILNGKLNNKTDNEVYYIDTTGELSNNSISYFEDNICVNINIDKNNFFIKRISDEYEIYMPFDLNRRTEGIYKINDLGEINLKIETMILDVCLDYIKLNYKLIFDDDNMSEFYYELYIKREV